MPIELTTDERQYINNSGSPDPALDILLSRLMSTPLKDLERMANEVQQAVQDYQLGEDRKVS